MRLQGCLNPVIEGQNPVRLSVLSGRKHLGIPSESVVYLVRQKIHLVVGHQRLDLVTSGTGTLLHVPTLFKG